MESSFHISNKSISNDHITSEIQTKKKSGLEIRVNLMANRLGNELEHSEFFLNFDKMENSGKLKREVKKLTSTIVSPSDVNFNLGDYFNGIIKAIDKFTDNHNFSIELSEKLKNSFMKAAKEKISETKKLNPESEIARFSKNYDRFHAAKKSIIETSFNISQIVNSNSNDIYIPNIVLGAGDIGTTIWLDTKKEEHQLTNSLLSQNKLPQTLIIAENFGNWQHDYTLAQSHSLIERAEAPANPKDFTVNEKYERNAKVNARHHYQANIISLAETQAPVVQGAILFKVEAKSRNQDDNHCPWTEDEAEARAQIRFPLKTEDIMGDDIQPTNAIPEWNNNGEELEIIAPKLNRKGEQILHHGKPSFTKTTYIDKIVYTDNLDICAGMGVAAAFNKQMTNIQFNPEHLKYDSDRQFTPVCDGNTFMLTSREEAETPRDILIIGGGGNATACYRKAFFGSDINVAEKEYNKDFRRHKESEVYWVSAFRGFDEAGYGTLASKAVESARSQSRLWCAVPQKVEEFFDEVSRKKKLRVTLIEFEGVYKKEKITLPQNPGPNVIAKGKHGHQEITIVCDQLVYNMGQDSSQNLGVILNEFGKDFEINYQNISKMEQVPVGIQSKDHSVHLWGGAAQSFDAHLRYRYGKSEIKPGIVNLEYDENLKLGIGYNDKTRNEWITDQKIASDAEWPGVMPTTRAQIRLGHPKERENFNVNLEDSRIIYKALVANGAQVNDVNNFIADLLKYRRKGEQFSDASLIRIIEALDMNPENFDLSAIKAQKNLTELKKYLLNLGVDENRSEQFIRKISDKLSKRFSGVSQSRLTKLIAAHRLEDYVESYGHSSIKLKPQK